MSMQFIVNQSVQLAGKSFTSFNTVEAEAAEVREVTLEAAKNGTLSTRTSATVGILTMEAGHGITTGARIDIYWDGGSRYGVAVGTVATNSVPFSLGDGDDLPDATTVITAQVADEETFAVTGDDAVGLTAYCSVGGNAIFSDGTSDLFAVRLSNGVTSFQWFDGDGLDNPIAGLNLTTVYLTQPDSGSSQTIRVGVLFN